MVAIPQVLARRPVTADAHAEHFDRRAARPGKRRLESPREGLLDRYLHGLDEGVTEQEDPVRPVRLVHRPFEVAAAVGIDPDRHGELVLLLGPPALLAGDELG